MQSTDLYTEHSNVINVNQTCPEHFRSYTDLYVNEEAELAVTFLGQNTCWNCSLGYYYKDGEKPASKNGATTKFPTGLRIGFVIATTMSLAPPFTHTKVT